jgi:hypothetical protein
LTAGMAFAASPPRGLQAELPPPPPLLLLLLLLVAVVAAAAAEEQTEGAKEESVW